LNARKEPKIGIQLKENLKDDTAQYRHTDKQSLDELIDEIEEE